MAELANLKVTEGNVTLEVHENPAGKVKRYMTVGDVVVDLTPAVLDFMQRAVGSPVQLVVEGNYAKTGEPEKWQLMQGVFTTWAAARQACERVDARIEPGTVPSATRIRPIGGQT